MDYIFAIKDKMGNLIAQNIPIHSGLGKEMAQFKIDHLQNLFRINNNRFIISAYRSTKSKSCI